MTSHDTTPAPKGAEHLPSNAETLPTWRRLINEALSEDKKVAIVIGLSAGKDSTAVGLLFQKVYPELLDKVHFVFADTGSELPETYEYLAKLEAHFGRKITHLISKLGPLEDIIKVRFKGFLPSPRSRYCTRMSKIVPFRDYMDGLAETHDVVFNLVGIRADEPTRTGYVPCGQYAMKVFTVMPLSDEGMDLAQVFKLVGDTLGLPSYYEWRTRSGCTYCYFQRRVEWVGLLEKHPDLFEHAKSFEKAGYTWIKDYPLSKIEENKEAIKARYVKRLQNARDKSKTLSLTDQSILDKSLAEKAMAEDDEEDLGSCTTCR